MADKVLIITPKFESESETELNSSTKLKDNRKKDSSEIRAVRTNQYTYYSGSLILAKRTGIPCFCKKECFELFTRDERERVLKNFNELKSKRLQDEYLHRLITTSPIKKRNAKTVIGRQRTKFEYQVLIDTKKRVVCRNAFLSLHGIGKKRASRIAKYASVSLPQQETKKHVTKCSIPHGMPENLLEQLAEFIRTYFLQNPHHRFIKTVNNRTYNSMFCLKDLHKLYLKKFEPKVYEAMERGNYSQPVLGYEFFREFYHRTFETNAEPDNDFECDVLQFLDVEIRTDSDEDEEN